MDIIQERSEKQLIGEELLNYLKHNGILQEINRVFLHPLGLELRLNFDTNEMEIWQIDDPKGYLMDRVNTIYNNIFKKLSARKHAKRTELLGFCIQVKDLPNQENVNEISSLVIAPDKLKLETILNVLNTKAYDIYEKILKKHNEKDNNLEPYQFDKEELIILLDKNIKDKDWNDVATIAMMLQGEKELKEKMTYIKTKATEYFKLINEKRKKQEEIGILYKTIPPQQEK